MEMTFDILPTIGQLLVGFFFLFFGVWNSIHWRGAHGFMVSRKIPLALPFLIIGIAWQTIGGLMLLTDFYAQTAALLLIPFTIISVFIFHPFWIFEGQTRVLNMICFISQLTSTLAALLFIIYYSKSGYNIIAILS